MSRREAQQKVDSLYKDLYDIYRLLKYRERSLDNKRVQILQYLERILTTVKDNPEYKAGIDKLDEAGYRAYADMLTDLLKKIKNHGVKDRSLSGFGMTHSRDNLYAKTEPYFTAAHVNNEAAGENAQNNLSRPEKDIFVEVLGSKYAGILDNIVYEKTRVTEPEIRSSISGMHIEHVPSSMPPGTGEYGISLPNGNIFIPDSARDRTSSDYSIAMDALLIHELFHQVQYEKIGKETAFQTLLYESTLGRAVYDYNVDSFIGKTIWDIPRMEAQAQFIEDFVLRYFSETATGAFSADTKKQAKILKDSGFSSNAINKVLNIR